LDVHIAVHETSFLLSISSLSRVTSLHSRATNASYTEIQGYAILLEERFLRGEKHLSVALRHTQFPHRQTDKASPLHQNKGGQEREAISRNAQVDVHSRLALKPHNTERALALRAILLLRRLRGRVMVALKVLF
jgi:hypothetical protein